jgi:pimeloyl-ACP methyl ester carboxylesterase
VVKSASSDACSRDDLAVEDFMIPSDTAGINLFVRNKRSRAMTHFSAERTLLFVHGSTYPAETAFDLRLDGRSWMDYIAGHGYDVYLVDVRGYGRSTRPPEMEQPAHLNPPIVRADTAIRDVGSAVEFILDRRGIGKLNLLGWSWGTTLMGDFCSANNDKVNKLALYAPQWIRTTPSLSDAGGELGAYRLVSAASARERWLTGVPEDKKATLIPPGWFETWIDATFASDPWGNAQTPKVLRAPNGTVQDSREVWSKGQSIYNPGKITVPVLLVHADWDHDLPIDMTKAYFSLLVNARYRRWVEIGEGTHSVVLEKNRMQLFEAVQHFLDEDLVTI